MLAIILFAAGLLLSALSFIEGESFWKGLHNTLYGLFGFSAALIGPLFIYIAILATLDKPIGSIGSKVWQCIVMLVMLSSAIQVFSYGKLTETGLWNGIVELFQKGILLEGGGLVCALIGVPLLAMFGEVGAKIVISLLLFVMVMIFTGGTLIGLFRSAVRPVKKIEQGYSQRMQEVQQRPAPEPAPTPKPGGRFNVDIPLDGEPPVEKAGKTDGKKQAGPSAPAAAAKAHQEPPPEPALKPMPTIDIPAPDRYEKNDPISVFASKSRPEPAAAPGPAPAIGSWPEPAPQEPPEELHSVPAGSFALKSLQEAENQPVFDQRPEPFSFNAQPLLEVLPEEGLPPDFSGEEELPPDFSGEGGEPLEEGPALYSTPDTVMRFRSAPGITEPSGEAPAPAYPGVPASRPQTTDEVIHGILRQEQILEPSPILDPEDPFPELPPESEQISGPMLSPDPVEEKLGVSIAEAAREARLAAQPVSSAAFPAGMGPSAAPELPPKPAGYPYPPIELLKEPAVRQDDEDEEELKANAQRLVETLQSFGVQTRVIDVAKGPAVTRYELQPSAGVKISKITSLADDIALNLAAAGVRIEAPIPNKPAVGIEVPNKKVSTVSIREIIDTPEFREGKSPLTMALGRDISGRVTVADIAKMPHMLIAGATGSGKSVCINSIIISLLYKSPPDRVKLLMVDPKVVELGIYNGIPHLLVPVVTDPKKAAGALAWAVNEMLGRYKQFADNSVRDIEGFNRLCKTRDDLIPMPHHVIIIDELADLMMAAPNEVEDYICRLAQMARAAGMHLIIATQRPSVDVITGVIKANIPSRIAFAVSSSIDSRTILDTGGAEKLLGRGDMLFYPVGAAKPQRVQGCFVSDQEVEQVVEFIKAGGEQEYDEAVMGEIERQAAMEKGKGKGRDKDADDGGFEGDDDMLPAAIECVIEMGMASTSMLQRKLKLGYARAARIVDQLEEKGVVGPYEGSKPRQVLITRDQWYEMKMNQDAREQ